MDGLDRQEILSKAIEKAIANGWGGSPYVDISKLVKSSLETDLVYGEGWWNITLLYLPPHDFAKALWGEEPDVCISCWLDAQECVCDDYHTTQDLIHGWQYHLQQMVIADDPIKYLGEHIGG